MISVLTCMGAPGLPPGYLKYLLTNKPHTRLIKTGSDWDTQSVALGQVPPVESFDVMVNAPKTVPGNYDVTPRDSGILSIDVENNETEQIVTIDIYSVRYRQWYGEANFAYNNLPPGYAGERLFYFPKDVTITPQTLADMFPDPEGNPSKVTALSGPGGTPVAFDTYVPGLDLDFETATMTGNPPTRGRWEIPVRGYDQYNNTREGSIIVIVDPIEVPDMTGFEPEIALETINGLSLSGIVLPDASYGVILSQDPAPGSDVLPGTEVRMYTRIKVPSFYLMDVADAIAAVEALGFVATTSLRRSSSIAEGKVIDQDPPADEFLDAGDTVALIIARPYPVSLVQTTRRRRY
jgi:PASTA domain-containing protein